jgi:hypothetical protein
MADVAESIPVPEAIGSLLDRLQQPDSPERAALAALVGQLSTERASLAQAVLAVGMEAIHAKVEEITYGELAASYTDQERDQRRAETASRRVRTGSRLSEE